MRGTGGAYRVGGRRSRLRDPDPVDPDPVDLDPDPERREEEPGSLSLAGGGRASGRRAIPESGADGRTGGLPDCRTAGLGESVPPPTLERHEGDPFRSDTFELALLGRHRNHLFLGLGPDVMADDFAFGPLAPQNRELWERDFVEPFDGVARKTLLHAEPGPDGGPRKLFIKGHFLCAAGFLARRHPDAIFLTRIREPGPRRCVVRFGTTAGTSRGR
ncbi:MAG: hypothetical protein ACQGVK_03950 [Myxococcota bacterium]